MGLGEADNSFSNTICHLLWGSYWSRLGRCQRGRDHGGPGRGFGKSKLKSEGLGEVAGEEVKNQAEYQLENALWGKLLAPPNARN